MAEEKLDLAQAVTALNEMTGAAAPFVNFARVMPAVQDAIALLRSHESNIATLEEREGELLLAVNGLVREADQLEKRVQTLQATLDRREKEFSEHLDQLGNQKKAALELELTAERETFLHTRSQVAGEVAALENQLATRKKELTDAHATFERELERMERETVESATKLGEAKEAYDKFMSSLPKK